MLIWFLRMLCFKIYFIHLQSRVLFYSFAKQGESEREKLGHRNPECIRPKPGRRDLRLRPQAPDRHLPLLLPAGLARWMKSSLDSNQLLYGTPETQKAILSVLPYIGPEISTAMYKKCNESNRIIKFRLDLFHHANGRNSRLQHTESGISAFH